MNRWPFPVLSILGLVVAAGLLLGPLPRGWRAGWRSELLDLGHVPLFAAVFLTLWAWLRPLVVRPVLLAVAAAGLGELLQHVATRTASWPDFAYGVIGALLGAVGVWAWQRRRPTRQRLVGFLLAAGLLTWPLLRTGPVLVDAVEGYGQFPTLADFATDREMVRWEPRQADLSREPGAGGRLTFRPGPEPYPSAILTPVVRDLGDYRWLCMSFAVEGDPLEVVFSVRSGPDDSGQTTHYQIGHRYPAGAHDVRLDLPEVAPMARPRPLDVSDVWYVQVFVVRPAEPRTIRIRRVWVEK